MTTGSDKVRIDKWLWAARFFKTRALAKDAITGGKVHVDGERVKVSRGVSVGDRLEITKGEQRFEIVVCRLSETRGPAKIAETLYEETAPSREKREEQSAVRKLLHQSTPRPEGRPDKKQRRDIIRFKTRD